MDWKNKNVLSHTLYEVWLLKKQGKFYWEKAGILQNMSIFNFNAVLLETFGY